MDPAVAEALLQSKADIGLSEVLDIAWLARRMSGRAGHARGEVLDAAGWPADDPAEGVRQAAGAGPAGAAGPTLTGVDLYPREAAGVLAAAGSVVGEVRGPAVSRALPDPIGLARALRALRRTRPSPVAQEVDEALSAEWAAATGLVLPVCRAAPEPYYELTMVCDTGPSMRLWDQLLREAARGAERNGSFRSVTVRKLCSDTDRIVLNRPDGDAGLGELIEPNGRRIVAFFTDGVSRGWNDGRMSEHAHRLAGYGPVVVIHLLPQQMWPRTGVDPLPVYFRPDPDTGAGPGGAGGTHGFRPAGWSFGDLWPGGGPPGGGPPRAVPVVPLAATPLTRWASLVAGHRGRTVSGFAWIVSAKATTAGGGRPRGESLGTARVGGASATVRLREFDAWASVRARRLLRSLSVAPLNLATMWLVHRATSLAAGETCDPSPLAEVFLSGLLHKRPGEAGTSRGGSDYQFSDGLRQLLVESMESEEAIRLFAVVSEYVTGRLGLTPLTFPAFLASSDQRETANGIDSEVRPLAEIAAVLLKGLGPAYRQAVETIEQGLRAAAPATPAPDTAPGGHSGTPAPDAAAPAVPLPPPPPFAPSRPAGGAVPPAAPDVPGPGEEPGAAPDPTATGRTIAVLGAPGSGKTSLLGAAWLAAVTARKGPARWNVVAHDGAAEKFIVQLTHYLAVERRFPDITLSPRGFTYRFRARLPDPGPSSATSQEVDFGVNFFDTGGAEFTEGYGKHPQVDRHLARAQRILILVDPLTTDTGAQEANVAPPLRRLLREHGERGQLVRGRLPHHVALCVSKFDQPDLFRSARRGGWVNQNADGDPCVPQEDAERFTAWLARSSPSVAELRSLVAESFLPERVSWFVLSAIGFRHRRDGSVDLEDCYNVTEDDNGAPILREPARPVNVLEPLAALGLSGED
ncbi:SAV_2336 N-terminal domain-related protein [Streptomyces sp. NPDC006733]|uniref:SAV_2336 N-terminal domain-related protein n=1 Tax=Streptomyces sp. NPDC006733 TaxID=3155460 RepID=UPI00340CE8A0